MLHACRSVIMLLGILLGMPRDAAQRRFAR
jgi:hypothetical protein